MRDVRKIIIHESASKFGDAMLIRQWHVGSRHWNDIGYHYVILNGIRSPDGVYVIEDDGLVEEGRPLDHVGAHTKGYNADSIGICLIGHRHFSSNQLFDTLPKLIQQLMGEFGLNVDDVYGHNEFTNQKTCPDIDMREYRDYLRSCDL